MNVSRDVQNYIDHLVDPRRSDMLVLMALGKEITKKEPMMWKDIIGFGRLHYKYPSGREGDMPLLGIASRKQAITLYMSYDIEHYEELKHLGKITHGKGCLYIKKLDDVDLGVLKKLMEKAIKDTLGLLFITQIER
ncbi:MAG: DUF1801 domain-containing protein [Acholeplasmataceae bacterium]